MKKFLLAAVFSTIGVVAFGWVYFAVLCVGTVSATEGVAHQTYKIDTDGWCEGWEPDLHVEIFYYRNNTFLGVVPGESETGEHTIDWGPSATSILVTARADCTGFVPFMGHFMSCTRHDYSQVTIYKQ